MSNDEDLSTLVHVEPVLAVSNIIETVDYWHHVLGFTNKWTWGEPPNHGGVSWQGAFVQFSLNPTLAAASSGNSIFIRVKNLPRLYKFHQSKSVQIVEPLENKPWGMSGYTVREINGYYIVFAGALLSAREKSRDRSGHKVRLVSRIPTASEYVDLVLAVGWNRPASDLTVEKILAAPAYAVIAHDEVSDKVVGCALILSDGGSFYYVKDVMVHPDWQSRGIGSMMMKQIADWLDENAMQNAFIGLFTGENLATFYKKFDFVPAFGMAKRIKRNNNET